MIDMRRHFHHIDGQFDIHVALHLPAAHGIGVFLGRLGHHGEAVIVEPVDQRPQRRIFLILDQGRVIESAHQMRFLAEGFQQAAIVDLEAEAAGRRIQVGAVDEERNALLSIELHGKTLLRL